jgi:hypothetical protein
MLYCKHNRHEALSGSLRFITWAFLLKMTANFQPSIIWYIKEAGLVLHQEVETALPGYINISASVMIMINAYCKRKLLKWCLTQMCCHSNQHVFWKSLMLYKKLLQVKDWKMAEGIYMHLPQFLALQIMLTSVGVSCPSHWTFEPNNQCLWTLLMGLYPTIGNRNVCLSNNLSQNNTPS